MDDSNERQSEQNQPTIIITKINEDDENVIERQQEPPEEVNHSHGNGEDDDDDDDDVEPKLIYDRIGYSVVDIMKSDVATCLTAYERFFAIGTQLGKVYIFDFQGNIWCGGRISLHRSPINQISVDNKGEFVASCSDSRVVISELYTGDTSYTANYERPVKAIAIEPNYVSSSAKRFVIGEADRVLLYERNLISRYKVHCLQQARGVVRTISWRKNFIAWSSDLCIKIYDVQDKCIFMHIDREKETDYRVKLDLYQCHFCWKDDFTLLAAWGNSIKVCCIKEKSHTSQLSLTNVSPLVNGENTVKYYVELVYAFNIEDNLIACGIAPFENRMLILCISKSILYPNIGEDSLSENKEIRIKMVEPLNADLFNDISDDILSPKEVLKTVAKSRDITMAYLAQEKFYFILCPKDLILAKPREEDDHINWLIQRGKFVEAIARIRNAKDSDRKYYQHSVESVTTLYIEHLFSKDTKEAYEKAAEQCVSLCSDKQFLWEREVVRFKQFGCLRLLAKHLPIGPETILEPSIYELVLREYLETDSLGFLNLIRSWPPNLYSTSTMISLTTNRLPSQSHDRNLLEALAELHTYECRYKKALFIFLQVGNAKKVFDLIWKHHLLHLLEDRIIELLQLDPEETSRLLIIHQDTIPSDKVVSRLRQHPRLLCTYMDRLLYRDPAACAPYHDLLFDLYATYEPNKIVPFLRQSNYIQLDKALEVCKKQNLMQAIVFIQGRMGNTHEALRIIIDKMDDINSAIEFCKEHGDADLWAELMDISVSKPRLLSTLLREVGTYAADPIGLIARIPEGLEVPNLMSSLGKILQDYRLQVTLEEGCRRVLNSDVYHLFSKHFKMRSRTMGRRDNRYCQGCQESLHDKIWAGNCILFQCGHMFHYDCLEEQTSDVGQGKPNSVTSSDSDIWAMRRLCTLCSTQTKKSDGTSGSTPTPAHKPSYI